MFEINYSQLIQYEILEKLVTLMVTWPKPTYSWELFVLFQTMLIFFKYS